MIELIASVLGYIMEFCYRVCNNYGLAIIMFTIITKILLMPLSVALQKNSIKMVKMQPAINMIKVKYFGDADKIADEQGVLFKKEKYSPFLSTIPLIVQIILLLGFIEVVYHPFTYILKMPSDVILNINTLTASLTQMDINASSIQLTAITTIKNSSFFSEFAKLGPNVASYLESIKNLNMTFLGLDVSWIPNVVGTRVIFVPIIAGLSAWLVAYTQNKDNVLQIEQSKFNKYGMLIFSVGLSLYLGWFVPVGVAIYWVFSNLIAVGTLYLLNAIIPPSKHVDYQALENSKIQLANLKEYGKSSNDNKGAFSKMEKADYKRFFSIANKHLVFYSEGSGFYKYFSDTIDYILSRSNVSIHYITRDPNDRIFEIAKEKTAIKPYYIGDKKMITLMMKMDADMVVMSTPDLENYYIKRSYVRKDVEYVYLDHGIGSTNLLLRTHALDHFDTIFCTGAYQSEEIRALEKLYDLKPKRLIECGYALIDSMCERYNNSEKVKNPIPTILIAPSWQDDNIMDSCLDQILDVLLDKKYRVIVRPHPQYVRIYAAKMAAIIKRYQNKFNSNFQIETDFSSDVTVYTADIVMTDWSGIGCEFSFTTLKPTIYINTPMKIMNPEWEKINIEPIDIKLRDEIGKSFDYDSIKDMPAIIDDMIDNSDKYRDQILKFREKTVFNLNSSAKIAGDYILNSLSNKKSPKK